jgi:hypothetical protein
MVSHIIVCWAFAEMKKPPEIRRELEGLKEDRV